MRKLIASAFSSIALAAPLGASEPVALITAFGPFAGRGVNGSATVARQLAGSTIAGARIEVLVLPVRWGEPERALPAAVARLHPVLLLGLGEGFPGAVRVETVGANLARAIPDEDRALPGAARLDPTAPDSRPARLRFAAAWFAQAGVPVQASDDAGGYLCNEALFTALAQPVPACGFVHLPPQEAVADAIYAAPLLPIVRTIIERNLAP